MERRNFLKAGCALCLAVSIGGVISTLSSCSTLPIYKTSVNQNKVTVPISLFNTGNLQLIRPADFEYDIALRKDSDGNYTALLMQCTHQDNQLVSTGNGFVCDLHGSQFNKEGIVTTGPAVMPLKKYVTEISNDSIIIHIN